MHSTHCTLHIAHCTLHIAHCCTQHTSYWTLHTAHCTLHTAHCTLHTTYCTLYTVHCISQIAHCILYIAGDAKSRAHYTLQVMQHNIDQASSIDVGDPGEARGCPTNTFVIHWLGWWWFVKISLQRRHAQTFRDCAFSHKIDYLNILIIFNINLEVHQDCFIGSQVMAILVNGGFCLVLEIHREQSTPAAWAAGLFF